MSIFSDNGFTLANQINPVGNFEYVSDDKLYHNDRDIANTFVLQKHDVKATLYYQPVISSKRFENGLKLYRTRHMQRYFTPDFVIKFENNDSEEYVILDAKFSNRTNIINKYLPDVMLKYANEIAVNADIKTPVMVWILQGKINKLSTNPAHCLRRINLFLIPLKGTAMGAILVWPVLVL